jgi:hypothetical protein
MKTRQSITPLAVVVAVMILGTIGDAAVSVSWVPHQPDCPVTLSNVTTDRTGESRVVFRALDLINESSLPIDEVTLGVLVGSNHIGTPRPMVAKKSIRLTLSPGAQERVELNVGPENVGEALQQDVLVTLGVVSVRAGGKDVWVSPVLKSGEFAYTERMPKPAPGLCVDDEGRPSTQGVVVFREGVAYRCMEDGTWKAK